MTPVHVYTALIDVLAYRHRLELDQKNGRLDFKDDLEAALQVFNELNDAIYRIQAISDTIIITCSDHQYFPEFLYVLKTVFISFLERGLFIRGGLSYSRHFQSGRLTYSHAIARAYELESNLAIYPRIVIDNNIIDMYMSGDSLPTIFNQGFIVRQNGVTFVDTLDSKNWSNLYVLARSIYENNRPYMDRNEGAFSKHVWFEQYLFSSKYADTSLPRYIENIINI